MAGYSGAPLIKKLGIKANMRMAVINTPPHYKKMIGKLPEGARLSTQGPLDFIHCFSTSLSELKKQFPPLKKRLTKTGSIWISWPKGSSTIETDLSGDIVRKLGLANGLVDIKVCAVDDEWSALKFVYRLQDRK